MFGAPYYIILPALRLFRYKTLFADGKKLSITSGDDGMVERLIINSIKNKKEVAIE